MKIISKSKEKIQQLKRRFPYIWFPIIIVGTYLLFHFFVQPHIGTTLSEENHDKISTLVSIVSSLAGILLAILSILLSLNKDNSFTKKFFASEHFFIYIITVAIGIIAAFLSLLFYLFFELEIIIISLALVTLSEFLVLLYYIFYLFKQYLIAERNISD